LLYLLRQATGSNLDWVLVGIAIVIRPTQHLRGEHFFTYNMHSMLDAGDMLLKLSRTRREISKPLDMFRS